MNVLTESPGWILHRCATELADRLPGVTVNARGPADLLYLMPAHRRGSVGRAVGFFTHPTDQQIAEHVPRYQGHVAMNVRVADRLRAAGADPVVIRPGALAGKTPITFGVCGRTYATDRKGEGLVTQMVAAGYRVIAWGRGWPCPSVGADVSALPDFYRDLDYLVVTSHEEGGPIPVIDAIAYGVPVIAPDVGWCWEFPCVKYERGDWHSLQSVLSALTNPPTWAEWAAQHGRLFARLVAA